MTKKGRPRGRPGLEIVSYRSRSRALRFTPGAACERLPSWFLVKGCICGQRAHALVTRAARRHTWRGQIVWP